MVDFFRECNSQGLAPKEFQQTFCQRCRNPDCDLAAWGTGLFDRRVATQAERLLNPQQADPRLPKYARIVETEFPSMMREAMMLEIADRRGDWEVPEIAVVDGRIETASPATTQAVDNAVRNLAHSYGQPAPVMPSLSDEFAAQALAVLGELSEVDPADVTSLVVDPSVSQAQEEAAVTSSPAPALGDSPKPTLASPPVPVGNRPPVTQPKARNTPMPAGGIMVGSPAPVKPAKPRDPWAPPTGLTATAKKVPVGAKIRMGAGLEEPEEKP